MQIRPFARLQENWMPLELTSSVITLDAVGELGQKSDAPQVESSSTTKSALMLTDVLTPRPKTQRVDWARMMTSSLPNGTGLLSIFNLFTLEDLSRALLVASQRLTDLERPLWRHFVPKL